MITIEQATRMFEEMVAKSNEKYQIEYIGEAEFEEPLYFMIVIDGQGKQRFPGEVFPCIRKADGALENYSFPTPA